MFMLWSVELLCSIDFSDFYVRNFMFQTSLRFALKFFDILHTKHSHEIDTDMSWVIFVLCCENLIKSFYEYSMIKSNKKWC